MEEKRGGGEEDILQRANCNINQNAASFLQWISHNTNSFSGLEKLEAMKRETITLSTETQRGLDFK